MTFDRTTIAPEAQKHCIEIGERFGSSDTLRQADKTLTATQKYGDLLAKRGFGPSQVALLADVRDALLAAGVTRDLSRAGKKQTNAALLDAMSAAKGERFEIHAIYANARTALFMKGDLTSVNAIDVALASTSNAGDDAVLLGNQLGLLTDLLKTTAIREAVGEEPASAIETDAAARVAALTAARQQHAGPRGTPAETEYLNLLDGLVAILCRNARKAARAVARQSGQPAIAKELQLTELYSKTVRAKQDSGGDK